MNRVAHDVNMHGIKVPRLIKQVPDKATTTKL
jgi:hypothetical protein